MWTLKKTRLKYATFMICCFMRWAGRAKPRHAESSAPGERPSRGSWRWHSWWSGRWWTASPVSRSSYTRVRHSTSARGYPASSWVWARSATGHVKEEKQVISHILMDNVLLCFRWPRKKNPTQLTRKVTTSVLCCVHEQQGSWEFSKNSGPSGFHMNSTTWSWKWKE